MNRSLMLTLVCCALTAPLAAQQTPAAAIAEPAVTTAAVAQPAPAVAPTPSAGPRIPDAPRRVEPSFVSTTARAFHQEADINHSALIYILVAAVLVVLLVFLIKRT